jgi:hypothetical protein
MRQIVIILLVATLLLAACQPVPPAGSGPEGLVDDGLTIGDPVDEQNPEGEASGPPVVQESPGETLSESLGNQGEKPPVVVELPPLVWDQDPETVVISATFCCGFVPQMAVTNYIPEVQIWGDGRIVWVVQEDTGSRTVFKAQLSQDEIKELLEKIAAAGFFGWEPRYGDFTVTDLADKCLQVNLESGATAVCEYHKGAPQAFHELYNLITAGAGKRGSIYTPEIGYLTVRELGPAVQAGPVDTSLDWDAAGLDLPLDKVGEGLWIKGPALELSWQAVNTRPWLAMVKSGDRLYEIGLQIPGLSREAPPTQ